MISGAISRGVRTGKPTNELEDAHTHQFEAVCENHDRLEQFAGAMTGQSLSVTNVLADEFPWQEYETVLDLGTSEDIIPKRIAEVNDHSHAIGVDLPRVEPHILGHILHDWVLDERQ